MILSLPFPGGGHCARIARRACACQSQSMMSRRPACWARVFARRVALLFALESLHMTTRCTALWARVFAHQRTMMRWMVESLRINEQRDALLFEHHVVESLHIDAQRHVALLFVCLRRHSSWLSGRLRF